MQQQLDLFVWADARPSNVVDAMPALIRKAAREAAYQVPPPATAGKVVTWPRSAA